MSSIYDSEKVQDSKKHKIVFHFEEELKNIDNDTNRSKWGKFLFYGLMLPISIIMFGCDILLYFSCKDYCQNEEKSKLTLNVLAFGYGILIILINLTGIFKLMNFKPLFTSIITDKDKASYMTGFNMFETLQFILHCILLVWLAKQP